MPLERCTQHGLSVVGVLVGLALAAILATGFAKLFGDSMNASRAVELRSDKEAIKNQIVTTASCAASMTATTCSGGPGSLVNVLSFSGATIVSATTPKRYGKWTVRAECNASADGIIVRAARLSSSGTLTSPSSNLAAFKEDPLTKRIITWDDDASLLMPVDINVCSIPPPPPCIMHDVEVAFPTQMLTGVTCPAAYPLPKAVALIPGCASTNVASWLQNGGSFSESAPTGALCAHASYRSVDPAMSNATSTGCLTGSNINNLNPAPGGNPRIFNAVCRLTCCRP